MWWEPAKDNGSPVTLYLLEGLKLPVYRAKRNANRTAWYHNAPSVEELEIEWESFYNGSGKQKRFFQASPNQTKVALTLQIRLG